MILGKIDSLKLVELFGTSKNKEYFKSKGKIPNSMKETLLRRAYSKYEIIDCGNGEYEIVKIRENEIPMSMYTAKKGIYTILCPLIIHKILYDYNKDNSLKTTFFNYAYHINSINKNYTYIKQYKTATSKKFDLSVDNMYDFYSYVDKSLKYYINTALELLKKCGVIEYYDLPMIMYREYEVNHSSNKINLSVKDKHRRATEQETRTCINIRERLMKEMSINNKQEAFFGVKSSEYKERLKEEYEKEIFYDDSGNRIKIILHYSGYEIYYTTIEKCENLLNEFEKSDVEHLIYDFNKNFINLTLNNVKNRSDNILDFEVRSKLINDYEKLSTLTLDFKVEDIEVDESLFIKQSKSKNGQYIIDIINSEY